MTSRGFTHGKVRQRVLVTCLLLVCARPSAPTRPRPRLFEDSVAIHYTSAIAAAATTTTTTTAITTATTITTATAATVIIRSR